MRSSGRAHVKLKAERNIILAVPSKPNGPQSSLFSRARNTLHLCVARFLQAASILSSDVIMASWSTYGGPLRRRYNIRRPHPPDWFVIQMLWEYGVLRASSSNKYSVQQVFQGLLNLPRQGLVAVKTWPTNLPADFSCPAITRHPPTTVSLACLPRPPLHPMFFSRRLDQTGRLKIS